MVRFNGINEHFSIYKKIKKRSGNDKQAKAAVCIIHTCSQVVPDDLEPKNAHSKLKIGIWLKIELYDPNAFVLTDSSSVERCIHPVKQINIFSNKICVLSTTQPIIDRWISKIFKHWVYTQLVA